MRESDLEDYLYRNPSALGDGLRWLGRQARVEIDSWLGGADSVGELVAWDRYKHGPKKIDLLGTTAQGWLAICEAKYTGWSGDTAPFQALEYHLAAKSAGQMWLPDHAEPIKLSQYGGVVLYLVIGGHVSRLLKRRVEICQAACCIEYRVFQAVPNTDGRTWSIERPVIYPAAGGPSAQSQ